MSVIGTAGTRIPAARRLIITSDRTFDLAGAGDGHDAIALESAEEGDRVPARSRKSSSITPVTVDGPVTTGARLFGAPDGKLSTEENGDPVFVALEDADEDGDIIQALPR